MSYDDYDGGYGGAGYDDDGYAGGLGGTSYADDYGGAGLGGADLGYRDYDSGLDNLGLAGTSNFDNFDLDRGFSNLNLDTDLPYGSSSGGLYGDLDSGVGLSGGSGFLSDAALGGAGPAYESGLDDLGIGAASYGASDGLGDPGLSTSPGAGLGGHDDLAGGSLGGLGGYDGLRQDLSGGYSGLDGYNDLGGLGGVGGFDALGSGGLDYTGSLGSLGWDTYDSGLDGLGYGGGLSDGLGGDLLEDAAFAAGGAALGAGAASLYNSHRDRGLDYGSSGPGGYGYGSGLYGDSLYDSDLGVYGHSSLGWGAYSGFNSGMYDQSLAYSDLANFQNSLYSNSALSGIERDGILRDRYAFDALDDGARLSAYQSYSPGYRSRLGLDSGYWGGHYGSSYYDPQYSAWGYTSDFGSNPSYYGLDYSYGYGDPSFYSRSLSSMSYGLSSPLRSQYSSYYSPSYGYDTLPLWSDDLRFREAADLSYYQQRLQADRNLAEAERMALWQQRQEWQALDEQSRRLRWLKMDEIQRERLGLGVIGSWMGNYMGATGHADLRLPYDLPSDLRSVYSPYMSRAYQSSDYIDTNYTRYNDLLAWSQALKYDRNLRESERLARWKQRVQFEALDEAARRRQWQSMPFAQRGLLGLNDGYWDSRYAFSNLFNPKNLRPMKLPVSSRLSRIYQPYQSKNTLLRALKDGVESALAFSDLVAFENAIRGDRSLRMEDKLRRWKARVRWQELSERERRIRFYRMQEAERRLLGLGVSSFFGRRYSAPIFLNGTRGLPPPRAAMPGLRAQLPSPLRIRYQPVLARQQNLATSGLSRSLVGQDPAKNLADRIRLSIAQKEEQLPGLSTSQRLAATEQKRQILRDMDNDRRVNTALQVSEDARLDRLRRMGY